MPNLTPNAPGRNFQGLWIPLVTPFFENDKPRDNSGDDPKNSHCDDSPVDHPALQSLVKHYLPMGIAGFVACGSTGEAAALDDDEQLAVLDTILKAADGLPVMMGVSGYNLVQTLAWVKRLNAFSATSAFNIAGLLVSAPHYIRPSQAGVLHWFQAIADASAVPLVLYDIPYRTGVPMSLETLLALAAHPKICAVKDCGGDLGKTQALIADGRLQVLAGEDAQIFGTVALGGAGAIAACSHLQTRAFVDVVEALTRGDLLQARAAWKPLPGLIATLFAQPNPVCIKAALAQQGLMGKRLRAPMMAAD